MRTFAGMRDELSRRVRSLQVRGLAFARPRTARTREHSRWRAAARAAAWVRGASYRWWKAHPRVASAGLLLLRTVRGAARIRVVGLAGEAAFFSLLSLPALLLGIIGTLGYFRWVLGEQTVLEIRAWVLDLAATALTAETIETVVAPLVDDFLGGIQGGILSVTFLVSLWSGSRTMNVFIEAICISYGLEKMRGYLRQRSLAFVAYLGGLLFALVVLPLLVAGPNVIRAVLPATADYLYLAYWPVVSMLSVVCLVALYAVSVPVRTPIWRHVPGALVAVVIWLLGSVALRLYLETSFGQVTLYGSLYAPIAVLAWLYVTALAVLVGSAFNAEIDAMWPTTHTAEARARIASDHHARAARLAERREQALRDVTEDEEEEEGEREETQPPGKTGGAFSRGSGTGARPPSADGRREIPEGTTAIPQTGPFGDSSSLEETPGEPEGPSAADPDRVPRQRGDEPD